MMVGIKGIWQCIFAPRLIKIYQNGPAEQLYEPSALETIGDRVLQSLYIMWKLGIYTSPLIVGFLYRRGYFEAEGYLTLTKFATLIGGIIVVSYVIRGLGRASNPAYMKFIDVLQEAQSNLMPSSKKQLSAYDFEFYAWPVEFNGTKLNRDDVKSRLYINKPATNRNILQLAVALPCHILAYIAVHTFGIRLVYPGSIGILQSVLSESLIQGRSKLVEVIGGSRYKLQSNAGNDIDALFVDRRNLNSNGDTLVVCSEGNAGFYEIGIMGTPIAAGYSVLGWNHPGFGGSTGTPYPTEELDAMDIVMQFAINKLGFQVENILLFGWSIGGFSSTWAAMNYPDVKGVILDASFDDIMPLAINHMPTWSESIVRLAIREYLNLNNFEQLSKYPGPVLFIRRTEDEVICIRPGDTFSNRGNNLLVKLLKYRFPLIINEPQQSVLAEYLSLSSPAAQEQYVTKYEIDGTYWTNYFETFLQENSKSYPMMLGVDLNDHDKGKVALFLARKYMKDYKTTHCTPLPSELFQLPWDIANENDFVFT